MAIQGLERGVPPVAEPTTEAGVIVDALERVGLVRDDNREDILRSTEADLAGLEGSGAGEDLPWTPDELVTLDEVVHALDTGQYLSGREYPESFVYAPLWRRGDRNGYSAQDLDRFDRERPGRGVEPHVRRALHNPNSQLDPKLHFADQPFDEKYAEEGQETQQDAIAKAKAEYEAEHEGFSLIPLNAKSVAWLALIQRIKGEDMPFNDSWMYDATMPRRTVGGFSVVGSVYSGGGVFGLDGGLGLAGPGAGVGLSVGPKAVEPQAS
jgi:hypothetical protein